MSELSRVETMVADGHAPSPRLSAIVLALAATDTLLPSALRSFHVL